MTIHITLAAVVAWTVGFGPFVAVFIYDWRHDHK